MAGSRVEAHHDNRKPKKIRSFVRREGRMSTAQQQALDSQWHQYGLGLTDQVTDAFSTKQPVIMEIGFGMGESLLTTLKRNPQLNFIGVEVHQPGVGALLQGASANQLANLRVFKDDSVDVLRRCIPDGFLQAVHVFFSDPWPKRRHHKRRLIQPAFIELVLKKLCLQGELWLVTDWEHYAQHMMDVVIQFPSLVRQDTSAMLARVETKYERRAKKLGHVVWDGLFVKTL